MRSPELSESEILPEWARREVAEAYRHCLEMLKRDITKICSRVAIDKLLRAGQDGPAEWRSPEAQGVHSPKVAGSNPVSATNNTEGTMSQLEEFFTYHAPSEDQQTRLQEIRKSALALAIVIEANAPACADRTAAIRKLREAVMTANAAVVIPRPPED